MFGWCFRERGSTTGCRGRVNYYKRHIGDYIKDTSHLSLLEHGVYTRLLDVYYGREGPIPDGEAARLIGARTALERAAMKTVLLEFFDLEAEGWRHGRCDEEIVEALESGEESAAKKENEKERQRRHRERRKVLFEQLRGHGIVPKWDTSTEQLETDLSQATQRSGHEPVTRTATAIHKPVTSNHKPIAIKKHEHALALLADVPPQLARDWLEVRKEKKAAFTETALQEMRLEAGKAGLSLEAVLKICCARGWAAFKASWDWKDKAAINGMSAYQQMQVEKHEEQKRFAEAIHGKRHDEPNRPPIDITPERVD